MDGSRTVLFEGPDGEHDLAAGYVVEWGEVGVLDGFVDEVGYVVFFEQVTDVQEVALFEGLVEGFVLLVGDYSVLGVYS